MNLEMQQLCTYSFSIAPKHRYEINAGVVDIHFISLYTRLAKRYASEIFLLDTPISRMTFAATGEVGDRSSVMEFGTTDSPAIRSLIAITSLREKATFAIRLS